MFFKSKRIPAMTGLKRLPRHPKYRCVSQWLTFKTSNQEIASLSLARTENLCHYEEVFLSSRGVKRRSNLMLKWLWSKRLLRYISFFRIIIPHFAVVHFILLSQNCRSHCSVPLRRSVHFVHASLHKILAMTRCN